ncbi:unnamed protein product [Calypogeia fissa]
MNGSMDLRTRWKGKNARETARGDPISAMYEIMKGWEAPRGLFADSSVLLNVDGPQAQLLSRACFGKTYPPAVQLASSASTYPPAVPEEGIHLLQLGLEEAFFLSYELKSIEIYCQTPEGRIKLKHEDLWRLMERSKKRFAHYYKAYSHLRSKRWVVLSGIQYGADFMAYRHHPALVHSDYAVLVMVGERKQERLSTWTDLHSMQRLCGSVAKTLLLLHVTPEEDKAEITFPFCLDIYHVEAVEVERWIPEKHREDVGLEEKVT